MDIIKGSTEWGHLAEGLPPEAVALCRLAARVADSITHIRAMLADKTELKSVEENLLVMKLGMDVEVLAQSLMAIVREHAERAYLSYVSELKNDLKVQINEIKQAQKSGAFAATAQGTADYVIKVSTLLNMIYYSMSIAKSKWLRKLRMYGIPRTEIQRDVELAVRKYLDAIAPIAQDALHILSSHLPKIDPEYMVNTLVYYITVIPTAYIPKEAYARVLDRILSTDNRYSPIVQILSIYRTGDFTPYDVTLPADTFEQHALAMYAEDAVADTYTYYSEGIISRLQNLPVEAIFSPLAKYTKKEILDAITMLIDEKSVSEFWKIFTREVLHRAGIHVEVEEEEKKTKKKEKKESSKETTIETPIELPPEVEEELMKTLEEEGL